MEDLVNSSFWNNKRVFVTGHTGFKGAWLCLWLQRMGASVTGYALRPATQPNLFDLAHVAENMNSIEADIRDRDRLFGALSHANPEIVFHLAAQPLVRRSYVEPVLTYETNVMGTVHLLDVVRRVPGVRSVVVVTSDKCYENKEWLWGYRESENLGGFDPYSSSKGCAEIVTAAFRSSYFRSSDDRNSVAAVASARGGNVIGGGDWSEDRLIPDIVRAISRDDSIMIRHPEAVRPWQHVIDLLRGYLILAQKLWNDGASYGEAWNFGPSNTEDVPVRVLAEKFLRASGGRNVMVRGPDSTLHEAAVLRLDSSKAHNRLGWSCRLDLNRSIECTAAWYEAYFAQKDLRVVTLDQIESYGHLNV